MSVDLAVSLNKPQYPRLPRVGVLVLLRLIAEKRGCANGIAPQIEAFPWLHLWKGDFPNPQFAPSMLWRCAVVDTEPIECC